MNIAVDFTVDITPLPLAFSSTHSLITESPDQEGDNAPDNREIKLT
jgi:hypothetical protein